MKHWKGRKNNETVRVGYWGTTDNTLEFRDNRKVAVGDTHVMKKSGLSPWVRNETIDHPVLCKLGMHASPKPNQVGTYRRSSRFLYLVLIAGDVTNVMYDGESTDDKFCGRVRTYQGFIEPTDLPASNCVRVPSHRDENGILVWRLGGFNWDSPNFSRAVRRAFIRKYPELRTFVEETIESR